MKKDYVDILGIKFITNGYKQAITMLKDGGLMVVPAAPALANIYKDNYYYNALLQSDIAIPDSSLMVLLARLTRKEKKIKKLSGLAFLVNFFKENDLKSPDVLFLIDPTKQDSEINNKYLQRIGLPIKLDQHYIAPFYNARNIQDKELICLLNDKKPKYILINIGGGVQEKLGLFLKNKLHYRPSIICTGAAIAFLTGRQKSIPNIIDKIGLGWLVRCICKPSVFIPRYFRGLLLIPIMLKEK